MPASAWAATRPGREALLLTTSRFYGKVLRGPGVLRVSARLALLLPVAIFLLPAYASDPQVHLPPLPHEPDLPLPGVGQGPCEVGTVPGTVAWSEDFEAGAATWTWLDTPGRPNLWHATTYRGNNSAHDSNFHGGPGRLYYGIENAYGGSYNTQPLRNEGEARGPAVTVPVGGAVVAFNAKWNVEWDRAWVIDSMMAGYVTSGGQRSLVCWLGNTIAGATNPAIGYGWYHNSPSGHVAPTGCEYSAETFYQVCRVAQDFADQDITFDLANSTTLWEPRFFALPPTLAGQTVHVIFWFQTGDAIVDDAMGFMVDDVTLVGPAP